MIVIALPIFILLCLFCFFKFLDFITFTASYYTHRTFDRSDKNLTYAYGTYEDFKELFENLDLNHFYISNTITLGIIKINETRMILKTPIDYYKVRRLLNKPEPKKEIIKDFTWDSLK